MLINNLILYLTELKKKTASNSILIKAVCHKLHIFTFPAALATLSESNWQVHKKHVETLVILSSTSPMFLLRYN